VFINKKIFKSCIISFVSVFLITCFFSNNDISAGQKGGTLKYGVKAKIPTYDPHATNSYGVMHYVPQHYSTLLTFNWDNFPELEGDVAESWNVSDDALTYTFNIRKGIKFHDGTALNAHDVKATYERLRNPPEGVISARKALFSSINSISTPDDYTVVFKLSGTDGFLMQGFGSPYNSIYSVKDMAKGPKWHAKNINGTGPFRFVEHEEGKKWVAKRYENYHFDDVYLDGTIGYQIKKVANPMKGGQIMAEWRAAVPPVVKDLKEKMGDKISFQTMPMLSFMMITLNSKVEAFQDVRVRRALTLCVDRYNGFPNLAKLTWTAPTPAAGIMPGTFYAIPAKELEKEAGFGRDMDANRAKAKALLKEAGHANLKFKYSNRAVSHPYEQIAVFLIDQWKRCGVDVELISSPTPKWVAMRRSGGFDVTIDFVSGFLPDPTVLLQKFISKDRSPQNYSGYTDRKLDELYDAQKQEANPEKRKVIVHQFIKRNLELGWTIPMTFMNRTIALNSKVKGYKIAPSLVLNTDWRGVWVED